MSGLCCNWNVSSGLLLFLYTDLHIYINFVIFKHLLKYLVKMLLSTEFDAVCRRSEPVIMLL